VLRTHRAVACVEWTLAVRDLRGAGGRQRIVVWTADLVGLTGLVGTGVRIAHPVRVAGIGRPNEPPRRGLAVNLHGVNSQVRSGRRVDAAALEVEAEARQ